jgi:hypothetical protein
MIQCPFRPVLLFLWPRKSPGAMNRMNEESPSLHLNKEEIQREKKNSIMCTRNVLVASIPDIIR